MVNINKQEGMELITNQGASSMHIENAHFHQIRPHTVEPLYCGHLGGLVKCPV